MHFRYLKVYYKAAVIVPFYTACFFVLAALLPAFLAHGFNLDALEGNLYAELLLQDVLYSGIIGFFTLTAFLNCYKKVAYHPVWRVLAWMLLPYSFIAYILFFDIDWEVMQRPRQYDMAGTSIMIILCFLHVIGIIISFIDFRVTALLFEKEEEKLKKEEQLSKAEAVGQVKETKRIERSSSKNFS
ncbi:MAG TPA: hypothetical protein VMR70_09420 [Flavisolibacter sp.]|nr:hypothetical protein [Flavisolibacter sp.]